MSKDISKVACPICDTIGKWESVDKYKPKAEGMHICTNCSMVFYPEKYMNEDEAKAYYENDYRKPPTVGNAYTGMRKVHMHAFFLDDLFKEWRDKGLDKPVVSDIGAAYGMCLNFVKANFPEAELNGTEFAKAYRRNSYHEFGIELGKDFDTTKKYDLISTFKVAEHQLDVKARLREYAECLKEDGRVYISVPTWFEIMGNFGAVGFDIGYYYHPDHINVWSEPLFEELLKMVGLEIVKKDKWMYDSTYLCKRNDSLMELDSVYPSVEETIDKMARIQKASNLYNQQKFGEAILAFPNFFEAHQARYESSRKKPHEGQTEPLEYIEETYIKPVLKSCPESLNALRMAVDIYMRYDEYESAMEYIEKALEVRPNQAPFLTALAHCLNQLSLRDKDAEKKIKLLTESRDVWKYIRDVDEQCKAEATNWIYQINSELPTPSELKQ